MGKCKDCGGTGVIVCPVCNGTKKDPLAWEEKRVVPCTYCGGSGKKPCPSCSGTGSNPYD